MELLSGIRTEYLLEAPLESLHTESHEWLNELEFWQDELGFFYSLLRKKAYDKVFPSEERAAIEKELVRLTGERLDFVKNGVRNHEHELSIILGSNSMEKEESYRERHRALLSSIHELHLEIRTFKRNLFSFVRKYASER